MQIKFPNASSTLACALGKKGQLDDARAIFRESLQTLGVTPEGANGEE